MRVADRASTALLIALTILVFILPYGPLMVPIISSFTINRGAVDWSTPHFCIWGPASERERADALRTTLIVGACAVVLSLVIGTGLALYYVSPSAEGRVCSL
jgi:putative spermidine/putrescine transport system permease protein/spermidine/putrescine transport system permease protein